jgi:hypothetical protein
MIRLFPLLWLAFKVWMVVDAHKRHAPHFWYPVIMFVPLGGVAYLLMVKLKDFKLGDVGKMFKGPTSVPVLRRRYTNSPSTANLIAWAQGLYDEGEFRESAVRFEEVLARDEDNNEALHGLGLAALQFDDFERALPALTRLVELNPSFSDYVAWPDLALALLESGKREEAVEVAEKLARKSPRVKHKVLLGHVLQRSERESEAREVLEQALLDDEDAASYVRRQNRPWVSEAKTLLREIEQTTRRYA